MNLTTEWGDYCRNLDFIVFVLAVVILPFSYTPIFDLYMRKHLLKRVHVKINENIGQLSGAETARIRRTEKFTMENMWHYWAIATTKWWNIYASQCIKFSVSWVSQFVTPTLRSASLVMAHATSLLIWGVIRQLPPLAKIF